MIKISELAEKIARREVRVEDVVTNTLDDIARANPALNAFITVLADRALADARRLDDELARGVYRGPLHGVPISVKDLIDVEGAPTTAASRVRAGHIAPADAPVVRRLREAGAVIIGKTNLHEFAYGTTSEASAYGAVHNPHDTRRSAGGSSGGSAAAIVAGLCAGSVGTDTGGSIRIPSAACGCVGLKPTYGEIPADDVVPLSRSLDHVGPMAADVASVREMFRVLGKPGSPPLDFARGAVSLSNHENPEVGQAKVPRVVAVPRAYFLDVLEQDVRDAFERTLEMLRSAGAETRDVTIAHANEIAAVYLHIQLPESSCYHATSLERAPELYEPSVRLRLEMGRYVRAEDYVRAQRGREVLRQEVDEALAGADLIALPTLPILAPLLGQATVAGATADGTAATLPVRTMMLRLTQLFNITGHPAISLPLGISHVVGPRLKPGARPAQPGHGDPTLKGGAYDRSAQGRHGLPVGLQLVGHRGETEALLDAALAVESTLNSTR